MHASAEITFEQIENRPLNRKQKGLIAAAVIGNALEFFDYVLVGFILTIIVGPWGLTFGQSAFLLLTSGVGAIIGSFVFGALADKIGRKPCFLATVLMFSLATGALALVPEGSWLLFGVLRLLVGIGVGGLVSVDVPLVQEFVPSRRRGFLTGLVVIFIPIGVLLGSLCAATLGPVIGWRGLVLIGLLPALLSLYIRIAVPESPRWLMHQGRHEDAKKAISWALSIPVEDVKLPERVSVTQTKWTNIFRYPKSVALTFIGGFGAQTSFYGINLWGPTLIALQLGVTPARAALLFIVVNLAAFTGRVVFSISSDRIGRRTTGMIAYFGGAVGLVTTAFTHDLVLGGISIFFIMLAVSSFFADGGFAVNVPYYSEVFPTDLRASGLGAAYGFGGLGKILGPAGLALISGAGTVVTPEATIAAIEPAFIYLAGFSVMAALTYLIFGIETKGKSLDEIDTLLNEQVQGARTVEANSGTEDTPRTAR